LKRWRDSFTLIELLIVVAIIAILALIAVPNFLEAQTRAKVSRVRTDHRTLATALEAYMVDWNSYTTYDPASPTQPLSGWRQLTTPVAYVTSLPTDPFGESKFRTGNVTRVLPALYELGCGAAGVGRAGTVSSPDVGYPSNTWEMNSNGPDKFDDTQTPANVPGHTYRWSDGQYPWVFPGSGGANPTNPDDPNVVAELLTLIYDPTNGTISVGEIFRTGGTKPSGWMFDVLYAVASGK